MMVSYDIGKEHEGVDLNPDTSKWSVVGKMW